MGRGLGSGETPERVVKLLQTAANESSQSAVARATGIPLSKINRYLKGVGEPQTETLLALAYYFGVSVSWLRGGYVGPLERLLEGLKIGGIDSITYNKAVAEKMDKKCDYWRELVAGNAMLNSEQPGVLCGFFGINHYWVMTGAQPTLLHGGGIVGTVTEDANDFVKDVNLSDFDFDDYMKWFLQETEGGDKYTELYEAFCRIPDENKEEALRMLSLRLHVLKNKTKAAAAEDD